MAGLGIQRDRAAGLLDDPVDGGQAQTGALAGGLGGEERIERAVGDLARHPNPVVGHDEAHMRSRMRVGMAAGEVLV